MKNKSNNKSWYSILISLMVIGFLMVVTSWVFKMVLLEMWDNKWVSNYLKSYNAAEGVWEFALLQIKEKWYAYFDKIEANLNNRSIILASDPEDTSVYNRNKDVLVSFDYNYRVNSYEWELVKVWYDIIPLFYVDDDWEKKVLKLILSNLIWDSSKFTWNIIWKDSWISWVWIFDSDSIWKWRDSNSLYIEKRVDSFLSSSDTNYLILLNLDPNNSIKYKLIAENSWEFFTKPRTELTASAEIWWYKQNLNILVDNTEFLNILKYSIYGN